MSRCSQPRTTERGRAIQWAGSDGVAMVVCHGFGISTAGIDRVPDSSEVREARTAAIDFSLCVGGGQVGESEAGGYAIAVGLERPWRFIPSTACQHTLLDNLGSSPTCRAFCQTSASRPSAAAHVYSVVHPRLFARSVRREPSTVYVGRFAPPLICLHRPFVARRAGDWRRPPRRRLRRQEGDHGDGRARRPDVPGALAATDTRAKGSHLE
eukprot:2106271-Pleurochrysis_carterae.AAC.2